MDTTKQIEMLTGTAEGIQQEIEQKNKDIALLKASLKFDSKRLKGIKEEIEFYESQVKG